MSDGTKPWEKYTKANKPWEKYGNKNEQPVLSEEAPVAQKEPVVDKKKDYLDPASLKDSLLQGKSDAIAQNTVDTQKQYITPELQKKMDDNKLANEEWAKYAAEQKAELEKDLPWFVPEEDGFIKSAYNAFKYAIPASLSGAEAGGTVDLTGDLEKQLDLYNKISLGEIPIRGEFNGADTKLGSLPISQAPDYGAYKRDMGSYPKTVADVIEWKKGQIKVAKEKSMAAVVKSLGLTEKLSYVETPPDFTEGGDFGMDLKKALGSQIPQIGLSVLLPGFGSYLQEQGNMYVSNMTQAAAKLYGKDISSLTDQELNAFMSSEEGERILNESQVYGGASASLDAIGIGKMFSWFRGGAKQLLKNSVRQKGTRIVEGMLVEMTTELGQDELGAASMASATNEAYSPNPNINTAITAIVTSGAIGTTNAVLTRGPINRVSENPTDVSTSDATAVVETGNLEVDADVAKETAEIDRIVDTLNGIRDYTNSPSYTRNGESITASQALWRINRGDLEGLEIKNDIEIENKLKEKAKDGKVNNDQQGQSESVAGEVLQDNVRTEPDVEGDDAQISVTRDESSALSSFDLADLEDMLDASEASGDVETIKAIRDELKNRNKNPKTYVEKQQEEFVKSEEARLQEEETALRATETNFQTQARLESEARKKDLEETNNKVSNKIGEEVINEDDQTTTSDDSTTEAVKEDLKDAKAVTEEELAAFSSIDVENKAIADAQEITKQGMKTVGNKKTRRDTGTTSALDSFTLSFEGFINTISATSGKTRAWLGTNFTQVIDRIAAGKIANEMNVASVIKKYKDNKDFNPYKVGFYSVLNREGLDLDVKVQHILRSLDNQLTSAVRKGSKTAVKEAMDRRVLAEEVIKGYINGENTLNESENSFYNEGIEHLKDKRTKWTSGAKQVLNKAIETHNNYWGRVVEGSINNEDLQDFSVEGLLKDDSLTRMIEGQIGNQVSKRSEELEGPGNSFYNFNAFETLAKVSNDLETDNLMIPEVVRWKTLLKSDEFKELTGGRQFEMHQEFKRRLIGAINKLKEKSTRDKDGTRVTAFGKDYDLTAVSRLTSDIMQAQLSSPKHLFAQSLPSVMTGTLRAFLSGNPMAVVKAMKGMFTTSDTQLKEKIPSLFTRKHMLDAIGEMLDKSDRKASKRKISYFLHKGDYMGSKFQTLIEYYIENPNAKDLDSDFDSEAMANAMLTQAVTQGSNTLANAPMSYRDPKVWQKFLLPFTMMNFNMSRQLFGSLASGQLMESKYRRAALAYSIGNVVIFRAVVELYAEALDEASDFVMGENEEDEEDVTASKFSKKLLVQSILESTSLSQVPLVAEASDAGGQILMEWALGDDYNPKKDRVDYPGSNTKALGMLESQQMEMTKMFKSMINAAETGDEEAGLYALAQASQLYMTMASGSHFFTSFGPGYGITLETMKQAKKSMKEGFDQSVKEARKLEKKMENDPRLKQRIYGKKVDQKKTKYRLYN
jgi:hypothetical protein